MRPRSFFCILCVCFFIPAFVSAQVPFHLSYGCPEDELQAAGLLCTDDEPCAIYLELSSVTAVGQKLFLAGNLHATSGTLASVLLASDDNGLNWKEAAPRTRGAALDQIQFYDAQHGWAAGETQYPILRDPYFLITGDSGVSWRQHPVTEEGGPGSVLSFWFDSALHGELTVDAGRSAGGSRYLFYGTDTGGDVWALQGTFEKAPIIKRAPPAADSFDYRLRALPNGKTYELEKRSGEKWQVVSSLLIDVASCKPMPPEAKEPQPEQAPAKP